MASPIPSSSSHIDRHEEEEDGEEVDECRDGPQKCEHHEPQAPGLGDELGQPHDPEHSEQWQQDEALGMRIVQDDALQRGGGGEVQERTTL